MGRYKTTHSVEPMEIGAHIKKSVIEDTQTGRKAEGRVWDSQSYDDADKKAMQELEEMDDDDDDEDD